jgi:hypothetical protein
MYSVTHVSATNSTHVVLVLPAGCSWQDIFDRDFPKARADTRMRGLVAGPPPCTTIRLCPRSTPVTLRLHPRRIFSTPNTADAQVGATAPTRSSASKALPVFDTGHVKATPPSHLLNSKHGGCSSRRDRAYQK